MYNYDEKNKFYYKTRIKIHSKSSQVETLHTNI